MSHIMIAIACFVLGVGVALVSNEEKIAYGAGMTKAITECEAELPRHQHCEPVYEARIVEKE